MSSARQWPEPARPVAGTTQLPARVCDLNEDRDPVALPANHTGAERRFLLVTYRDLVARLRIERRIVGARAV